MMCLLSTLSAFLTRKSTARTHSAQFIGDLAKFEHTVFPHNPARRPQRAAGKSFPASCGVVDLPAPCLVLALRGKSVGCLGDDLSEAIDTDREVRTPHQSGAARLHRLAHTRQLLKPSSRPRNYRNAQRSEAADILGRRRRCGKFHD